MKKIFIIYCSETGNTEIMAKAISIGAKDASGEVTLLNGDEATVEDRIGADVIVLGSPAMSSEQLQVTMERIEDIVSGKPVTLFGSYD